MCYSCKLFYFSLFILYYGSCKCMFNVRLSCLHCQALTAYLMFFGHINWCWWRVSVGLGFSVRVNCSVRVNRCFTVSGSLKRDDIVGLVDRTWTTELTQVLVSLRPINAKYIRNTDARDQWTRRVTGSTCSGSSVQFDCLKMFRELVTTLS